MYDIGIPEINVTARSESEDGRAILYTAEAAHRPECCANPACGHKIKPHVILLKATSYTTSDLKGSWFIST